MLDKIIYTNHLNEQIKFGDFPYFANYSELRDYSWEYTETNSRILSFRKEIKQYKLPVVIMCMTEEEGFQRRNDLFEITEKDVLAKQYGTLQIGEYKLQCYVQESKKSKFLNTKKYMEVQLTVLTDKPYWLKENVFRFRKTTNDNEYLDFPYDMPYDFKNSLSLMKFVNTNFTASNFRIIIYGAVENPKLLINSHAYEVETSLVANETLTIDSFTKTIEQVSVGGTRYNKFSSRNKDSYIFEKIATGKCAVLPSEKFDFDIIIYEERGEPKWT